MYDSQPAAVKTASVHQAEAGGPACVLPTAVTDTSSLTEFNSLLQSYALSHDLIFKTRRRCGGASLHPLSKSWVPRGTCSLIATGIRPLDVRPVSKLLLWK